MLKKDYGLPGLALENLEKKDYRRGGEKDFEK